MTICLHIDVETTLKQQVKYVPGALNGLDSVCDAF